jgi:hypothetical protein
MSVRNLLREADNSDFGILFDLPVNGAASFAGLNGPEMQPSAQSEPGETAFGKTGEG